MKIYKYHLEVKEKQQLFLPEFAKIIALQIQNGMPCIWVKIPEIQYGMGGKATDEIRTFITVGTGHTFSEENLIYVGTYQLGAFVGHVFEERGICQ